MDRKGADDMTTIFLIGIIIPLGFLCLFLLVMVIHLNNQYTLTDQLFRLADAEANRLYEELKKGDKHETNR
jgi:hypothetical protein